MLNLLWPSDQDLFVLFNPWLKLTSKGRKRGKPGTVNELGERRGAEIKRGCSDLSFA